ESRWASGSPGAGRIPPAGDDGVSGCTPPARDAAAAGSVPPAGTPDGPGTAMPSGRGQMGSRIPAAARAAPKPVTAARASRPVTSHAAAVTAARKGLHLLGLAAPSAYLTQPEEPCQP